MTDRVTVADVRLVWEKIRPLLEEVRRNADADWRVEDMYHLLRSGDAQLFLLDGGDGGMAILQLTHCPYTLKRVVFIVAIHGGSGGNVHEGMAIVDQFARDVGAEYIETFSRRRGLVKRGFEQQDIRYRRRL